MQALQRLGTLGAAIALTLSAGTAKAALVINQQGALTARDAVFEDGSLYDQYTFSGRSGQQVIISLESQEFDPYLILLDPDRRRINENDDVSRNNRNSRLVVTLPTTGTYTAVANSYESGKNGRYTIKVEVSDGQSSARTRAIAREMAAAAVPNISSRCNTAVLSAIDNIEQGRDIGVLVDAERLSDRFRTVPAARPNGINMGLGGPAALSVMFSPQFLTYISSTLMRDCTTVGAVVYSATEAGFERTFGYLPGRGAASSVPVGEFTCSGTGEGREKPEWGTRLCL